MIVAAGMWKVFEKAGEPGWAALIPIYNLVVLVKIAGKEMWWVVLMLLPCINFVAAVMISSTYAQVRKGHAVRRRPRLPAVHLLPDPGDSAPLSTTAARRAAGTAPAEHVRSAGCHQFFG